MTTEKIAVTVPKALLRRVKSAVHRGGAASLSAYVSAALEQKAMLDDLDQMLATMLEETGGPITVRERRRADLVLDGRTKRRRT